MLSASKDLNIESLRTNYPHNSDSTPDTIHSILISAIVAELAPTSVDPRATEANYFQTGASILAVTLALLRAFVFVL